MTGALSFMIERARRWALSPLCCVLVGCADERATPESCGYIFERIVELELAEQGFRDPALAARKKHELRSALRAELARCPGRRLRQSALSCVQRAMTTEEISHVCLR